MILDGRTPMPAASQLLLRIRPKLKADLEQEARAQGHSLSAEAVKRLEESLVREAALGGRALAQVVSLMAAAFARSGQFSAADKPPEEWLNDPAAYIAATVGVVTALMHASPLSEDEKRLLDGAIISQLATLAVQRKSE
jgi:hypothetical protein